MIVIGWRTWYVGGAVYDSVRHLWADMPNDGFLRCRLYFDEVNSSNRQHLSRVMEGSDYYFKAREIYGETNDPPTEILARYPGAEIKRGQWTTEQEMYAALEAEGAAVDPP